MSSSGSSTACSTGTTARCRWSCATAARHSSCRWRFSWRRCFCSTSFPKGFFPDEDTGQIFAITEASQDISFDAMREHQRRRPKSSPHDTNVDGFMSAIGAGGSSASLNNGRMFMRLKPASERRLNANQIIQELRAKLAQVPGIQRLHAESAAHPHRRHVDQGAVSVQPAGHRHEGAVPLGAAS